MKNQYDPVAKTSKVTYELMETNIQIDGCMTNCVSFLLYNKYVILSPSFRELLKECTDCQTSNVSFNDYKLEAIYRNQAQVEDELKERRQKILQTDANTLVKSVVQIIRSKKLKEVHLSVGCLGEEGKFKGFLVEIHPSYLEKDKREITLIRSPEWQHILEEKHLLTVDIVDEK